MIDPLYGVKCLKLGFDRYIRYSKLEHLYSAAKRVYRFMLTKKMAQDQLKQEHQIIIQIYKILQKEGMNLG